MKRLLIALLCITVLPHCIGPKMRTPHHTMPKTFMHQHDACNTEPLRSWWEQFNDHTLNRLIQKALKHNYDLHIATEKIEEFRARATLTQAQLFPKIDGILETTKTGISKQLLQTAFLQRNEVSLFRLGFDAIWELDFFGKIWRGQRADICALHAQIESMHLVYITLIADVARTYIDICSLEAILDLIKKIICTQKELLQLDYDRYTAGLDNAVIIAQQEQVLASLEDQILLVQETLDQTYHALAILLGIQPECLPKNTCSRDIPLSQAPLALGIPSELLRRRPDIRRAELQLAQAYELVGQAIAEWFPSFTLFGFLDSRASRTHGWFNTQSLSWNIGPSIRMPLLNFGRITARIQEQESVKRQAALMYSNTIINALKEVEDALVSYFTAQDQRDMIEHKLASAQAENNLIADQYQSGLADKRKFLEAEKQLYLVEREAVAIKQKLSTQFVAIYKALGGGW